MEGIIKTLPMGVSRINDRYFFTILAEDAITFNIPHMKIQQVENHEKIISPPRSRRPVIIQSDITNKKRLQSLLEGGIVEDIVKEKCSEIAVEFTIMM